MATRKRPPLTESRSEYVDGRVSGRIVGEPLYYPAAPADQYSKEMRRLIKEMERDYRAALLARFDKVEEEDVAQDASMASQLRMRLNSLKSKWIKVFTDRAPSLVSSMINRVDQTEQRSLGASLKQLSGGVTLKTDIMPASLTEALTSSTNENVSLIKSIQQQFHTQVEGYVMRSIQPGGRGAADIKEGLTTQLGVNDRRATRIAIDQTRKITTAMNYERSKALGVKKFKWLHSGGSAEPRPLHKNTLNGKIFSYDDLPVIDEKTGERGLPGQLINCHPGYSRVQITNGCVKLYRRRHSGELVTLVASNGVILEATPNHPVLTGRGWVAAHEVNLGDDLIQCGNQGLNVMKGDIQNAVSTFDQLFDLASLLVDGSDCQISSAGFDFHGDATDNNVDVVDVAGMLGHSFDADVLKVLQQLVLACAKPMGQSGLFLSASEEFFAANLFSPDGVVSGLGALFSKLWSEPGCVNECLLRLSSLLDSTFPKGSVYHRAADAVFFGEGEDGASRQVLPGNLIARKLFAILALAYSSNDFVSPSAESLRQIVSVDSKSISNCRKGIDPILKRVSLIDKRISEYSGHVYNLESVDNWYVVNGFITHNCRCVSIPVLEWGDE